MEKLMILFVTQIIPVGGMEYAIHFWMMHNIAMMVVIVIQVQNFLSLPIVIQTAAQKIPRLILI